ncbi:MAG: hypothetical protein ACM3JB_01220 [Acidobacteriaceae bacterium]
MADDNRKIIKEFVQEIALGVIHSILDLKIKYYSERGRGAYWMDHGCL